jgi:uncharacterized membrane protein YbaN (DUF454 family)
MEGLADSIRPRLARKRLVRWAYCGAGFLLVGLGVVGIILPLVPTTIFLLGAAACFGKASPGAYRWLTTNRVFGRYLNNYREHRGATLPAKIGSIAALWAGLAISAYFIGPMVIADVALALVGVGVTWHLLSLKTIR